MDDVNFTTHMLIAFLKKYGDMLQEYFINDALTGKYMSTTDLYNYLYPEASIENALERDRKKEIEMALEEGRKPEIDVLSEERTTPKQPNFSKDYIWTVTLINRLLYDKKPCQKTIDNFFTGAFAQVSFPKNSENSYWENLFAYAWVHSQGKNFECYNRYYKENKDKISTSLNEIIGDVEWYRLSVWNNMLWSIELFRLRLFLDTMQDNTYNFMHILDWIDIFEYRIVPKVLERVSMALLEEHCSRQKLEDTDKKIFLDGKRKDLAGITIYKYFMEQIDKENDFPYAERYGLAKRQKENIMRIRKMLLPLANKESDVNMEKDIELYADLINLLKKEAGLNVNSSAACKNIRTIIAERNKSRDCYRTNGSAYSLVSNRDSMTELDTQFMHCCLVLFAELTEQCDISDTDSIMSNLIIYHMLRHEQEQQGKDDFPHPLLTKQKEELDNQYALYRRNILAKVFQRYTENQQLHMDVLLSDITDELLAEMLMVGSALLKQNESDNILEKIFQDEPSRADEERNTFINQSWGDFDTENKMLYALFASEIGKLERIRGYVEDDQLSPDEIEYIKVVSASWKKEISDIHNLLHSVL